MNKNVTEDVTDWSAYYLKPKSKFSTFTQKFTLKRILYYMEKYIDGQCDIMELGGGNSCFAQSLIDLSKVSVKSYSIVDNCRVAVSKFKEMKICGEAYLFDLTKEVDRELIGQSGFVFSIGLIEHFRGKDIEEIIKKHFALCKEKGVVLISVPTPTLQYRLTRKLMEKLGVWGFPDERPLRYEEISEFVEEQGTIKEKFINYKLPLTQLMIVAVKK